MEALGCPGLTVGYTRFSMPAPTLETEADADAVHLIVVEALDARWIAMRDICRFTPNRDPRGLTYLRGSTDFAPQHWMA